MIPPTHKFLDADDDREWLEGVLTSHSLVPNMPCDLNQEEAIHLLLTRLDTQRPLLSLKQCSEDIKKRLEQSPCFLGNGILLPHAITSGTTEFRIAIGLCQQGIRLETEDGAETIQFVILCICPPEHNNHYLRFLYLISRFLLDNENRKLLLNCTDSEQVKKLICG